jgi:signal peptidase I
MKNKIIKFYHWSNSWTGTIVLVLLFMFFVAQAFLIPSGSMKNTLLVHDALFAKKFAYGVPIPHIPWLEIPVLPDFKGNGHLIDGPKPKRGDIVIFRYPLNTKLHFVKRCVAKGGDKLFVKDKQLYLRIENSDLKTEQFAKKMGAKIVEFNGEKFILNPYMPKHKGIHHDPDITEITGFNAPVFNYGPIIVPEKQFFMMGDNRDHSADSRFWGPVEYKNIVGKPWFIYMSWDDNYKIRWNRVGKSVNEIEKELNAGILKYPVTEGHKRLE